MAVLALLGFSVCHLPGWIAASLTVCADQDEWRVMAGISTKTLTDKGDRIGSELTDACSSTCRINSYRRSSSVIMSGDARFEGSSDLQVAVAMNLRITAKIRAIQVRPPQANQKDTERQSVTQHDHVLTKDVLYHSAQKLPLPRSV
jgi:hypothetical protein